MRKKDLQETRGKSQAQLRKLIEEKAAQLASLRAEIKIGKHKNVRAVKNLRHEIAQLKTVLREKELEEEVEVKEGGKHEEFYRKSS